MLSGGDPPYPLGMRSTQGTAMSSTNNNIYCQI